jgi:hypothetical protein
MFICKIHLNLHLIAVLKTIKAKHYKLRLREKVYWL